ncbi:MAG: hypothetical protein A2445_00780 [Candidatus Jacksonbacteria bacterium RIFOXYC2_FULL_44_29]|nr:MAG: Glycosyl transferase group 1 [Parcubacteria group bacterium GW2011_GWA2_42_28]KKT55456.1 MAG: Glycosyl transferase group 1 [Parcubacteria group bacterium GW2011_GWC2_44_22]OGY75235.1 MAG: hypothetical protein A2240_05875 [Candidatus Jacksonbacteria bacterium RIFOXYA2_FULL_43_12]OGY75938.1 MAG: hypothetical protein A2295_03380 [Candidatus Jacksonbacteria bacterium RIFOXYB2_FULL_44_15]OGY77953.1 MAG: hypothetical protein A2445_00780 [Candidatus Jacksonbacteria bacterium RIFOXYC2_FULL_44_2
MSNNNLSLLLTLEYPPDVGGIAEYYAQQVKKTPTLRVLHLKSNGQSLSWLRFFKIVKKQLQNKRYQYIQVGQILPLGYLALVFKFLMNQHFIVYVHGLDALQATLSRWKKFWIKKIFDQADYIAANSNYVKNCVSQKYHLDPQKIVISYPTIDLEFIENSASKLMPLDRPAAKIVLSVGRLVERKGFDSVIRALANLSDIDWVYWIVGDGPYREYLESLISDLQLGSRVKLCGRASANDLYRYFKTCDVFAMPSRERAGDVEGFGIVYLEAGAFKKPSIGGRSGGIPEAIEDGVTGILVDPENVMELQTALAQLLQDSNLAKKMGEAAYSRVKQKIST